jgi:hypothetical protein
VTYQDGDDGDDAIMADVEVLNAIMADTEVPNENGEAPRVNGDEAELEMTNENEKRQDELLIVDSCDE